MYFVIKHSSGSKQYQMTDAYNKPYISVKNVGLLPLTTNTTNGTYLKVTKSVSNLETTETMTYRPLEYKSQSDTFYSSAENSEGLSSTTALTKSSTSGTSYLTRESTSDTVYGTQTRYTRCSLGFTETWFCTYRHTQYQTTNTSSGVYIFRDPQISITGTYASYSSLHYAFLNSSTYSTYSSRGNNSYTASSTGNATSTTVGIFSYNKTGTPGATTAGTNLTNYSSFTRMATVTSVPSGVYYSSYRTKSSRYTIAVAPFIGTITTGTTYLTRESTYDTSYLTCESTSGYSGVSSSALYTWE